MAKEVHIEGIATDDCWNNWNELIIWQGDKVIITQIHCEGGPHTFTNQRTGQVHTVPESWLRKCGVLK